MKESGIQTPVNLKEIQESYASLLEETNSLIKQHLLSLAPQSDKLSATLEISRGKQLRPLFTYSVFKGFNSSFKDAPRLAAVFESIHIASLLHDDVIDKCHLRRNMPTMNDLYGDGVAILLGDLVFVAIYRLAASLKEIWLIEEVNDAVHKLIEGELLQQQQRFNENTREKQYQDIIARKTAALLELCSYASARFAGRSEDEANLIKEFAHHFGIIFQIVDDWADFCRSKKEDHKDRGVDIANGFLTLPWLLLLESCSPEEKNNLHLIIKEEKASGLNDQTVRDLAEKYGLAALIEQRISSHSTLCREALLKVPQFDSSEMLLFLNFINEEFNKISDQE